MRLAQVLGSVVSSHKESSLEGLKLLLVQPLDQSRRPTGRPLVATDSVGAGYRETVLLVSGKEAAFALARHAPVDTTIVGIVDPVHYKATP